MQGTATLSLRASNDGSRMSGLIQLPMSSPMLVDQGERDERPSYRELLMLRRLERRRELLNILGIVYLGASMLPKQGGGQPFGPVLMPNGDILRWSMWAPAKNILIDIFSTALPKSDELDRRHAFAAEHGLNYGIVTPGERLSLERLREELG